MTFDFNALRNMRDPQRQRNLPMSWWMKKTVIMAHYSRLHWFLIWSALVVFLVATVLLVVFVEQEPCETYVPGRAACAGY